MVREAAKKRFSTNGLAITVLPPNPLELNGHRNFFLISTPSHSEFCSFPKDSPSPLGTNRDPCRALVSIWICIRTPTSETGSRE